MSIEVGGSTGAHGLEHEKAHQERTCLRADDKKEDPIPVSLRLFITGGMPGEQRALADLVGLRGMLDGLGFRIEIVDILRKPEEAEAAGIVVTPTLSDESATPPRRMIGNFGNITQIVEFFGRPRKDEVP